MNWKKKLLALGLSLALTLSLAACGQKTAAPEQTDEPAQTEEPAEAPETPDDTAAFKIAALKGPTAMGLVELMSLSDTVNEMMEGKEDVVSTGNTYEFTLAGSADEVTPLLIKGELDMACVPANLAAVRQNGRRAGGAGGKHAGRAVYRGKRRYRAVHGGLEGQDHRGCRQGQHTGIRSALSAE